MLNNTFVKTKIKSNDIFNGRTIVIYINDFWNSNWKLSHISHNFYSYTTKNTHLLVFNLNNPSKINCDKFCETFESKYFLYEI